ncbi:DUF262 domain-containing protein [Liquorilactobacillus hordei]|uniref:DUF262 domain-containing protein n=1 Tax=Liquorilactobacillus hordei TaxID=468911 RepID=UPI001CC108F3|nr:DUF262 domain-containing protein [Liquorilactobacillus hordei]MBZ2405152.1 hypothetical protein [Liquorilactobacillus hordei]
MNSIFKLNTHKISEIAKDFREKSLIVDHSYQRRSIWSEIDKIRLIETILLGYVVPSLYFWDAETDPETGTTITHIVDGQQRILAITDFINGKFKLSPKSLITKKIKNDFGDLYFSDMPPEVKNKIWNYNLSIVQIDDRVDKQTIVELFARLNLTEFNLNDQERRNSSTSLFHKFATSLSENEAFKTISLFSTNDIRRMRDIEFCCILIILMKKGIIDQSNANISINSAYDEYFDSKSYPDYEDDVITIENALKKVLRFFNEVEDKQAKQFIKRKTQFYTLMSFIFYCMSHDFDVTEKMIKKFDVFTKIYASFKNIESQNLNLTQDESNLYDIMKQYKQSSSEGVNKVKNRMIRFTSLKNYLLEDKKIYTADIAFSLKNKLDSYN